MSRLRDRLSSEGPKAQLLRFLLVGASNFALSFALFHGLLALPAGFAVAPFRAQLVSYSVGTAWSFFWNRQFTFRATGGAMAQASRFLALQATLALVSAVCVEAAIGQAGLSSMVAWFTVMSAVTIVNFLLSRHWAFGR